MYCPVVHPQCCFKLSFVLYFFSLSTFSFLSHRGSWIPSQLHMGKVRVHPWVSHFLNDSLAHPGPYVSIWGVWYLSQRYLSGALKGSCPPPATRTPPKFFRSLHCVLNQIRKSYGCAKSLANSINRAYPHFSIRALFIDPANDLEFYQLSSD